MLDQSLRIVYLYAFLLRHRRQSAVEHRLHLLQQLNIQLFLFLMG
jgi:hypothetical protein